MRVYQQRVTWCEVHPSIPTVGEVRDYDVGLVIYAKWKVYSSDNR